MIEQLISLENATASVVTCLYDLKSHTSMRTSGILGNTQS